MSTTTTELKDFTLNQVKSNGKGLEVTYTVQQKTDTEVYMDKLTMKSAKLPHPDLVALLNALKTNQAEIHYMTELNKLLKVEGLNLTPEQIKHIEDKQKFLNGRIRITGVSISGKEDNVGVIITATLKTDMGMETAINSPRLKYNGKTYGFEETLEETMQDLEREVHAYLFDGKMAEPELAFADEDTDEQTEMPAAKQTNLLDQIAETEGGEIDTREMWEIRGYPDAESYEDAMRDYADAEADAQAEEETPADIHDDVERGEE